MPVSATVIEASEKENSEVTRINLSKNRILDPGAESLKRKIWDPGKLPQLKELDLSFNRISSTGLSFLTPLLERESFEFLNIVGNPEATIESRHYFTHLGLNSLGELIWTLEKFIEGNKWTVLLRGRDDFDRAVELVRQVHKLTTLEKNETFEKRRNEPR